MRKIIRYWNQNRKQIIIVIAIIAFIIIMLQVVNELLKPTKESNQIITIPLYKICKNQRNQR